MGGAKRWGADATSRWHCFSDCPQQRPLLLTTEPRRRPTHLSSARDAGDCFRSYTKDLSLLPSMRADFSLHRAWPYSISCKLISCHSVHVLKLGGISLSKDCAPSGVLEGSGYRPVRPRARLQDVLVWPGVQEWEVRWEGDLAACLQTNQTPTLPHASAKLNTCA